MKNTLDDNPYLENIVRTINGNLKMIDEHPDADKIGMMKYVIKYCYRKIEEMDHENDNYMGSGTS